MVYNTSQEFNRLDNKNLAEYTALDLKNRL